MQLLHEEKNINFERKNILKVFYNHKTSNDMPIGKWENLRLEDGKLKADAVFDDGDEIAMKIFGKIERGILESISVGISILKYTREQRDNDKDLIIVTKWEIYEASIVNIPAIPNAKVGLEFENEIETKEHEAMDLEKLKKEHPDLYAEVYNLGKTEEGVRVKAIDAILKPELAQHFTELKFDGKSTATDIELAQYRKIDELKLEDAEKLKLHKKKIDSDGVNLGLQVLDMGLDGDATDDKDAKKIAAEKLENEEDENAFFSGSGVRKDG
jgi:HK97 family phage prohead protease